MLFATLSQMALSSSGGSADPLLVILTNGGVVGAVLILTMFGKGLHGDEAFQQLKQQNAEKDKVIEQLMTLLQVQVVPALGKSTQVIEAGINKETALVDRLSSLIEKIEAQAKDDNL